MLESSTICLFLLNVYGWLKLMIRFAVVNPYPKINNAETECIRRMGVAAQNIGAECVVIDPEGLVMGTNWHISQVYSPDDVLFVLSIHHSTPKITNYFTYHAAWNPPEFFGFGWPYEEMTQNVLTCDDILTYDSIGIKSHLQSVFAPFGRTLEGTSTLVTGCSGTPYDPSVEKINKGKLFYCGLNWERIGTGKGRHHEIFRLLDKHPDKVSFYGPRRVSGIKTWQGYACYRGEIPFDGTSLVKTIHENGIALALSAKPHQEAEAASNRIFESCAAGAFIIADNNGFVRRTFGDAFYPIIYDKEKPQATAEAILAAVDWAHSHADEAYAMANECQRIYLAHFTYEKQLKGIIDNHVERRKQIGTGPALSVDVIVPFAPEREKLSSLKKTLLSVARQTQKPNSINVVCPVNSQEKIENFLANEISLQGSDVKITLIDPRKRHANFYLKPGSVSTGTMLAEILPNIPSEYFVVILPGQELIETSLGRSAQRISQTKPRVLINGYRQDPVKYLESADKTSCVFELMTPSLENTMRQLRAHSLLPAVGALVVNTEFARSIPNLEWFEGNWLGLIFVVRALIENKLIFSGSLSLSQSNEVLRYHNLQSRLHQWQIYHLQDCMRPYPEWILMQLACRHINFHYPRSARLKNFLRSKIRVNSLQYKLIVKILYFIRLRTHSTSG
jgi:hypothetical protein